MVTALLPAMWLQFCYVEEALTKCPQHLVWRATAGYFTNSPDSRAFRRFPIFLLQGTMLCTLCWLPLLAVHLGQLEKRLWSGISKTVILDMWALGCTRLLQGSVLGAGLTWSLEGEHKKSFLVFLPANLSWLSSLFLCSEHSEPWNSVGTQERERGRASTHRSPFHFLSTHTMGSVVGSA